MRISPLIFASIVMLAAASTIGLVLWSSSIQHTSAMTPDTTFVVCGFADTTTGNSRIFGDPINDPRPN